MIFPVTPQDKAAILRQYEQQISRYPVIRAEVDGFLQEKSEIFSLCLKYLYGHMSAQDMLSTPPAVCSSYVQATLQALEQIDYVQAVPADIFFPYVLYPRVNSEYLDGSRGLLLAELLPHVQGKSLEQAALSVNYWCYAHATYTPADDRTLGPVGILNRTLGRCGEESVLAVSALRSVGIPARQCYCPRWSHCDDNHAWVEVWIDGVWHYLGACEPEPVLDRGWFTAAASRAMLVDTKCWAGEKLYKIINCTAHYTKTRMFTVQVTDDGLPVAHAQVRFQVVNYSELYTLWETQTDAQGFARFETGPGDLFVYARHGQKVALQKVDLRQQDSAVLHLQADFPAAITEDLVPPADSSGSVPYADDSRHQHLLKQCEGHLAAHRSAFAESEGYIRLAAGNAPEIQAFLADSPYPQPQKEALLSTLRPKDFVDISREVLEDALEAAIAVFGQHPADIYRDFILAPRIADEMLLPERRQIRGLFPAGFADPQQIHGWMQTNLQILPDEGVSNYYPSALGCLRCRQVPAFAFDMVFVALCRAFRFPARLDAHTKQAQWMDGTGAWHNIHPATSPVRLTLEIPAGKKLNYFEHLTLGLWDGRDFATLQYPELTIDGSHTFCLQPGLYRITATTRQIDGTASVAIFHLQLQQDQALHILPPQDQTPQRLKQVPLSLPKGPLQNLLEQDPSKNLLLIFADPGSEPTEHLLREMLDCGREYRMLPCRILVLVGSPEALAHPTVRLVQEAIPEAEFVSLQDPDALAALYRQMQVGDLRLPFVVCADRHGHGVYADANYRIRLAQTLLDIQKLLRNP